MIQHIARGDIRKTLLYPLLSTGVALLFIALLPVLQRGLSPEISRFLLRGAKIFLVASVAWLSIGAVFLLEIVFHKKYDVSVADNLNARKFQTQFVIFKRLLLTMIVFVAFSIILLSIDDFRRIGTSLLASVGVVGIVVGLAAQKTVATILAGIQLAVSQPIRIDDVVVAEGEWGRVEQITFTYVVLRLWDQRRLVLPTTYFLERPFQNWTRISADLIATAYFRVDFSAEVEELRVRFFSILGSTPLWDGKARALQVTDCGERSLEIRALMSAANGSSAWDLRCLVREEMTAWLRDEHPEWLPRIRLRGEEEEKNLFSPSNG